MDFSSKIGEKIKNFKEFSIPTIVSDVKLQTFFTNKKFDSNKLLIENKDRLLNELGSLEPENILKSLFFNRRFNIDKILPDIDYQASFLPLYSVGEHTGFAIMFTLSDGLLQKVLPNEGLRAFDSIKGDLNHTISDIFAANDALLIRSDFFNADWALPQIKKINMAGYRLLRLNNNVSTYLSLKSSSYNLNKELVDLKEWLKDNELIISELLKNTPVNLTVEVFGNNLFSLIDIKLFETAIFNIIHNAVYYSKGNNNLTIQLKKLDEDLKIIVKDEGGGIKESVLEEIFLDEDKDNNKTNMLGLKIARQVAEKHGGEIEVYSKIGVGTEVTMTIPSNTLKGVLKFAQKPDEKNINDRYSPIYIGLTTALDSPYLSLDN